MTLLTARSIPRPEEPGSNSVIVKFYLLLAVEKTKINKKRPGMNHFRRIHGPVNLKNLLCALYSHHSLGGSPGLVVKGRDS